ncbi:zinc finger CCCH-type with G patch domain-containing protein [Synchiropus splendidus]|uniref:zinc finger CCCH-type with G patch domain-containing protein n=1 Tax=Synchiropus splendidus TaxID=270530 RepID=UPI00237E4C0C|nr:zinc finger CCCH-type with G patch domain-containing protein [Synchiropus splendidus]
MDEESLEAEISTYEAQVQQVDAALSAGLDPAQTSDLLKLKEDLCQLIELTRSSLVSVKKSNLLASLENIDEASSSNGLAAELTAFYSEVDTGGADNQEDEEEEDEEEEEDSLSGSKVRAPYRTSWGTLEYHNAMVVGSEPADGDEAQVKVLYLYPTQKSMKPCPFHLEDKCLYQDNCRFSHGEVVYVSELRDFVDCDLSTLEEGSSCLARHDDGIWYPARIADMKDTFYTVKFDSLLMKDAVVEADAIIPPLREDEAVSSSDSDDEDTEDRVAYARMVDAAQDSAATVDLSSFGGWEAHTRGIGSKLMLKMGYEFGKGLGRAQEGRVEPVMAVVLPKLKSLDKCLELTQRRSRSSASKDGSEPGQRKRRRRKPRASNTERSTVFDFLNKKLNKSGDAGVAGAASESVVTGVEVYNGGKSTKRNLNVKLFQAAERVSQTEREILKLTESLARHNGRDATRVKQLQQQLSAARHLLTQQKAQEASIQKEHKKADTHKKMTEF